MKISISLKRIILPFAISQLPFALLCGCQKPELYKDKRIMMGTFVEVASPDKKASAVAFEEIKRIEGLLSKYKPDSEVSQLNKTGKARVSPDTAYILRKAKEFYVITDGAFDITVAPLLDLWGFSEKKYRYPKKEEVAKTLKLVGTDKIIFNQRDNLVEFKIPGMKIDLGAIAKGYAVDCAINKLKQVGIKSCLIRIAGDIYCLGDKFGQPWRVAIQDPRGDDFLEYLDLKDQAVSTSGDYEQYFIKDKKRYSHIFNPKSGYPTESGVVSVTVVANAALTADALATSIFVLGKEQGELFAKKFPEVKVKIVEERDVQDTE